MKNQKPTKCIGRKRKQVEEVETEMASVEVAEHVETEMASEEVDKHTEQESEPVQTTQSEVKKKRVRGPTKMRKLAKEAMEKVDVDFHVSGQHSGPGSVTLSSFLGTLVREHVPVLVDDWRAVDGATKDRMWDEIKARFNIEEGWQRHSVFTKMCGIWRSSKSRLVAKLRQTKNANERLKLKPSNIHSLTSWNNWVKSRTSAAFKVKSEKYRKLRKSQIPHTTSRKGMFRLSMDMKKKSSDPKKVTRSKVWLAGHTHSDGRPVKKEFADTIERIQAIDSQMDSTATENVREDAVSQVLGKDRYGRVRGMGRGISLNKLDILNARDSYVQKLLATQAEMATKMENMQSQLDCLAGKNDLVLIWMLNLMYQTQTKEELSVRYWIGFQKMKLLSGKENSARLIKDIRLVRFQSVLTRQLLFCTLLQFQMHLYGGLQQLFLKFLKLLESKFLGQMIRLFWNQTTTLQLSITWPQMNNRFTTSLLGMELILLLRV